MSELFNLLSLFMQISKTEESAKEFLQENKILKTETLCPKCKSPCRKEVKRKNYRFFKCSKCNIEESITKHSFLYNKVYLQIQIYSCCNILLNTGSQTGNFSPCAVSVLQHEPIFPILSNFFSIFILFPFF